MTRKQGRARRAQFELGRDTMCPCFAAGASRLQIRRRALRCRVCGGCANPPQCCWRGAASRVRGTQPPDSRGSPPVPAGSGSGWPARGLGAENGRLRRPAGAARLWRLAALSRTPDDPRLRRRPQSRPARQAARGRMRAGATP